MTMLQNRMLARLSLAILVSVSLTGCGLLRELQPAVAVKPVTAEAYIAQQRGDVLTTSELSALTLQTVRVTGLDQDTCATPSVRACLTALSDFQGISDERRLSALSELWLQHAMQLPQTGSADGFAAWMEAARHAYAYLFFTARTPGERAFEDRQTQVRDWYNYAVLQATSQLFRARSEQADAVANGRHTLDFGGWTVHVELNVRLQQRARLPQELVPASSLSFHGMRSTYRREGFGAEFVAVMEEQPLVTTPASGHAQDQPERGPGRRRPPPPAWSEMPSPNLTVLFQFPGETLDAVLQQHEVTVSVHDPLVESALSIHGQRVPLSGNFTAGYGLWLARSGFNRQSLRSLLGREQGIERPHLYMMQPFDPDRRVILMLHGLASSPEAWVNVANEVLGDEGLRAEFQVWQIYYPTNMPVVFNHAAIRRLLHDTLDNFDPGGGSRASQGMVVIGHSMGGMIARLMVSSADEQLWGWVTGQPDVDPARVERLRPRLDPVLRFGPHPGIERAIFIAAPHRGTPVVERTLVRWVAGFVRLPLTVLQGIDAALMPEARADDPVASRDRPPIPTSIDNLDEQDGFVRAAADLPIADRVRYHSIVARVDADGPLEESDDGLVPYRSSHLRGAASEKVIVSGHSVQETAAAILEIRRILHEDMAADQ